ncbi:D-aminoacyl-tRNA deacylase [Nevskia ramosa]|uniref:D-aminoacyl-tRNA deacylase n=1 Tax=Nevskia ramosa TaxID=64002 RepID=UPI0003B60327|nr:D-aminoacyl-tRNA deacylase [Nevskia ramosa]
MIGLLQRVSGAKVEIDGRTMARIERGLLVLIGIERDDTAARGSRLLERLLSYRVFEDDTGRMNKSLRDLGAERGGLLLVSQFTLAADTRSGTRASFTPAAAPDEARALYTGLVSEAQKIWPGTASGVFGADMQISLVNDGPVTFWLEA